MERRSCGYSKLEIRAREDICDRSSMGELSRFLSAWFGDVVLPRLVLSVVLFAFGCLHARFLEYFCFQHPAMLS